MKVCSAIPVRNSVFIVIVKPMFFRMKYTRAWKAWFAWIVIIHMEERINSSCTE
jgi:hypothetical protein